MKSKFKKIIKCFVNRSEDSGSTSQPAESMLQTDTAPNFAPCVDIFETDLFNSDFDMWFAKSMFQYCFLEAILKEHLGHAVVNPKAVLEQIEASYWKKPSQTRQGKNNLRYSEIEIFSRIKAARATNDGKTLQVFLEQLSIHILSSCRRLHKGNAAELEAEVE